MIARRLITAHPALELIVSLVLCALLLIATCLLLLLLLMVLVLVMVRVGKLGCHLVLTQIAVLYAQKRIQIRLDDHVIGGLELFQEVALFQRLIGIQVDVVVVGELAFA